MSAGLLVQVSGLEPPVSVSKLQVKHLKPKMKDFKIYHWLISFSCRINCRIPSMLSSAYNSLIGLKWHIVKNFKTSPYLKSFWLYLAFVTLF